MTEEQLTALVDYIDARIDEKVDDGRSTLKELGELRNSFGLSYFDDGSGAYWGGRYADRNESVDENKPTLTIHSREVPSEDQFVNQRYGLALSVGNGSIWHAYYSSGRLVQVQPGQETSSVETSEAEARDWFRTMTAAAGVHSE